MQIEFDLREYLDEKFTHIDSRFELMDNRFEHIDQRFELIDQRFELIDKQFEQLTYRLELIDKQFEHNKRELEDIKTVLKEDLEVKTAIRIDVNTNKTKLNMIMSILSLVGTAVIVGVVKFLFFT